MLKFSCLVLHYFEVFGFSLSVLYKLPNRGLRQGLVQFMYFMTDNIKYFTEEK